jgi:TPR repeat protein
LLLFHSFASRQDLEKDNKVLKEENAKLKQLAKSQVENIIEPAAKKGDVGAIQVVGECYEYGLGGKRKDEKQAIEYYEKGVTASSPASQCSLGKLLVIQKNDVKANERGVELLKKSAAADFPAGQHHLAALKWTGKSLPEDRKSAVELWKKAAEAGYAESQNGHARSFEKGLGGVEKDMKQAEQWYLKAAESGNGNAQLVLGRIYQNDEKMKDMNKAIEWYEKAYYNGNKTAGVEALWRIFDPDKKGICADFDKAIEWAYRAQQHVGVGYFLEKKPESQNTLSTIKAFYRSSVHDSGVGAAFNNLATKCTEEFKTVLFRRAAVLGHTLGQFQYAQRLPDADPNKLKYLRLAADSSGPYPGPDAQWGIGALYETGRCGLEKNAVLAKEWKDKALANGYKPP